LPDINIRGPVVNKAKIIKKEKEKDSDQMKERDSSNLHNNHNNINSKKLDEEKEQVSKESSIIMSHQNEGRKKQLTKDPAGLNMIEEEKDNSNKVLREKSPVQKKEHHRNNSGIRKDLMVQEESYQGIQISRKNLSPVNNSHKNVIGSVMPPITNSNSNRDTYELPQVKNVRKKDNT
jgi:hypothetical protein